MEKIETNRAPAAIGPYSQAIKIGPMLFVSGQIPLDPATGALPQGIEAQTEQVFHNMEAILKEAGFALHHLVKMEVFMTDLSQFDAMNRVYAKRLAGQIYPARYTVEVSKLPKGALIEIGATAYQP